ncbi:S41 family peptidase [Candidatus Gracilibacteria bacterium]|nr:S41 family peptidase [Candidatus Gracilibacteria bacterium]
MKNSLKLLVISLVTGALLIGSISPAVAAFPDVGERDKYFTDIQYIENSGIFEGPFFKPNRLITRGEYAEWIMRHAGFDPAQYTPKTKKRFADLSVDNEIAKYVYRMVDLGILKEPVGVAGKFNSNKNITTYDALLWLFQVEGITVPKVINEASYGATDVSVESSQAPVINKAIQLGVIEKGAVHPMAHVARGRAAHFIHIVRNAPSILTISVIPNDTPNIDMTSKYPVMAGVWDRIFETYIGRDKVNKDKLIYGAVQGMVKELDDKYSTFTPPGDVKTVDSLSGQVEGIGAVIQDHDGDFVIVTPLVGSPAEKAGILADDIIDAVDGVSVKGMTLTEAIAKIKGKKGTQVKLRVLRNKMAKEFLITRDVVRVVSTSVTRTVDNIAVITLSNFGANTVVEFATIAKQLQLSPPRGIIIDLRNNPGGYLSVALQLAGYYVNKGETITFVKYPDHEDIETSHSDPSLRSFKTVVLINNGSASASEIFAGALQDYRLATIVGEKSYGKGTVQEIIDFVDGSSLKLTVAEWLTPLKRHINKDGITPELTVKMTDDDRKNNRDPQLDAAVNIINGR